MPMHDKFTDRRTDTLLQRHQDALQELQARWPQGTLAFVDSEELVLWVVPSDPLSTDTHRYGDLLTTLKGRDTWACLADNYDTALTAMKSRGVPAPVHTSHRLNTFVAIFY